MNCISRKSICIGRELSCTIRKPIFKKIKIDSCAGNWVSDLWNQNSFVRNPPGNGIVSDAEDIYFYAYIDLLNNFSWNILWIRSVLKLLAGNPSNNVAISSREFYKNEWYGWERIWYWQRGKFYVVIIKLGNKTFFPIYVKKCQ